MMITELSPELRHALADDPDRPIELVDPKTNRVYVLVSADVFRRMQASLEDTTVQDMAGLLADLAPEDWEDPANYDEPGA